MPPDDRIEALTGVSRELVEQVSKLRTENAEQLVELAHQARVNKRITKVLLAMSAFAICLTLIVGFSFIRLNDLAGELDASQQIQRQEALCPLYKLFLDSRSLKRRAQAPDPEAYDHAFEIIERGYKVLHCVVLEP